MMFRTAALGLMALAVGLFVTSTAHAAKDKGQHGTVKSAAGGKLVVTDKSGNDMSYDVAASCTVTIDGDATKKLEDLKAGDKIGFKLDADGKVSEIHKGKKPKV
jgi:hypothetical protein